MADSGDGIVPSPTSLACANMLRLGTLLGDRELIDRSRRIIAINTEVMPAGIHVYMNDGGNHIFLSS